MITQFANLCKVSPFELPEEELRNVTQNLRPKLQPSGCDNKGRAVPTCGYYLHIGVFFDGTNNNKYFDTPKKAHSNVARLYDVFPGEGAVKSTSATRYVNENDRYEATKTLVDFPSLYHKKMPGEYRRFFRKIYIPGVGTPFPDVGDNNSVVQNKLGEATASYGNERILWAIWQTLNLVIEACGQPRLTAEEINRFARAGGSIIIESNLRSKFHSQLANVLPRLKNEQKPSIYIVKLYVFGFSRGAAAARSYCSRINNLLAGLKIGVRFHLVFLGVFDTVASVGLAHSGGGSGHYSWASNSLMQPKVSACVHAVAAHEVRGSFPLSSVRGISGSVEELVYPGVHSDIGGGYLPFEQGKSLIGNGDAGKLSQIPLADMYRRALFFGVPFLLADEWRSNRSIREAMEVDSELISAFNAYHTASKAGNDKGKSTQQIIYRHYGYYIVWRKLRLGKLAATLNTRINHSRNTTRARDLRDIADGDLGLKYELNFLAQYREKLVSMSHSSMRSLPKKVVEVPSRPKLEGEIELLNFQSMLKQKYQEWNGGIKSIWEFGRTLEPAMMVMFDQYVHDSRAWFRIEPPEAWGYLRWRHIYF